MSSLREEARTAASMMRAKLKGSNLKGTDYMLI